MRLKKKGQEGLIFGGIIALIIIVVLFLSIYTIPAGYRGVLLTFGKPSEIVSDEGLHFKIPFAQTVKKIEVRTQKIETGADSTSKDLQDVQTTIALNFHVIPDLANKLYQEIGMSYQERVVDPAIQESVKAVMARFTAEELVAKRPQVRSDIEATLDEKLNKYHVFVDGFNIVDFQFSEEFDKAIEAKVTAEQLKLKADRDLERIIIEKQQKITQAEAEAEALRLQKLHISPELIDLREIEAKSKALDVQKAAIEKWDGILPKVTGGIPFISFESLETPEKQTE